MKKDKEKIKIENEIHAMHGVTKQQILEDFEEFKAYLHQKISAGKKLGLDDSKIIKSAAILGDYLAKHEEPCNAEEKLLQEMWDIADDNEKQHLAQLLVKLAGH
ncbi:MULTISPECIES: DUF3243 domain-containing protein [Bacillus]|uniref:DUF3243 domain-containing protein n=1 Tax=Bacillus TaxID=1386 RepID=UPI001362893E|nr:MULTISPECIES: DUF3243 domain-containing protein [Bacillus]MBT9287044.1 DUF3243 domain-containing protein [Bacillus velezensis]MCX2823082.1 DUF3243 domain-containing protein [Bacillus sp. H1F1]QHJ02492.1 DUF3243 family protein [Bacillus sp. AM1(2019)]